MRRGFKLISSASDELSSENIEYGFMLEISSISLIMELLIIYMLYALFLFFSHICPMLLHLVS